MMQLLTTEEAVMMAGVSDRTLRKYVRSGRLTRVFDETGRACYQRAELEGLESGNELPEPEAEQRESGTGRVRVRKRSAPEAESLHHGRLNGARHESASPECACCRVWERQVGTLEEQLEHRAEELRRRDQAESELRRLMAALTEANRHLTGMLEQKALPPAVEVTPQKVRWWRWWRR